MQLRAALPLFALLSISITHTSAFADDKDIYIKSLEQRIEKLEHAIEEMGEKPDSETREVLAEKKHLSIDGNHVPIPSPHASEYKTGDVILPHFEPDIPSHAAVPDWGIQTSEITPHPFPDIETFVKRGDTEVLKEHLHGFISTNPRSKRRSEAYYWLGDIALNEEEYDVAKYTLHRSYDLSPYGPVALEALLKLSYSYGHNGEHEKACNMVEILKSRAHMDEHNILLGHAEKSYNTFKCDTPFALQEQQEQQGSKPKILQVLDTL